MVTCNTFGLFAINRDTFNLRPHGDFTYPESIRNIVITGLKISNLTLNILGYIPGVSFFSGLTRIAIGSVILVSTLALGQNVIKGYWYEEAITTGIAQIARGALESLVPYGRIVNGLLDIVGTVYNIGSQCMAASECSCSGHQSPYENPEYCGPLKLLYLV